MKKRANSIYYALKRLAMGSRGVDVLPGNAVDLSHLTPDEIELLKEMGAIREEIIPAEAPQAPKEGEG